MHISLSKLLKLSATLIFISLSTLGCTTNIIPVEPKISVDQEYLHFAVGGGLDPHPQTLHISNVGGGTLYWTATVDAPWISVTPTSGTAPSTAIVSVKIPEGAPKLVMGKRQGKITISSPEGINNPLTIWVNFKIFMQGRAAYIYNSDATIAEDYKTLFQKNGYEVDLIMQNDVLSTDLSRYMYVVIGPDTGKESQWGDAAGNQARHVADSRKSCLGLLGLGKGGAAFYSQLGVKISWANGIRGSSDSVYATSKDLPFWSFPYRISISEDLTLKLYTKESSYIAIHQPIIVPDSPQLIPILKTLETQPDYPVIVETNSAFFYVLWGFDDGPSAMTLLGQRVFINVLDSLPCNWGA